MILRNPEVILPTIHAVKEKAAKLKQLYMKRLKKHEGRRPKKELFVIAAACMLFEEKNSGKKTGFTKLADWLQKEYGSTKYDFDMTKLYKWKRGRPFKEMQYQQAWDDIKTIYEISCNGASKGEMSQREIQRKHSISKQDLEDFTGFILSVHIGNKKTSDKFVFDRSDK